MREKNVESSPEIKKYLDNIFNSNLLKLEDAFREALKPIPDISIADWCEENLVLPSEMTAEPGKYSIDRTPYFREVLECLHPSSPYNEIVVYAGTQLGKTQVLISGLSFVICNNPANMLFGFSNKEQKNTFVQRRLNPFIDANPVFKTKFFSKRKNEKAENQRSKAFSGGSLFFASAEAPADFRSNPCKYIFADEIDAYPIDAKGEGSPIDLARRRTSTFHGRHKIYLCSTTTNKASQIKAEYEKTDMRELYFACPYCNHIQKLDFFNGFHWDAEGTFVKDVWFECESCHGKIRNEQKNEMYASAVWMPTNPIKTDPRKVGFHLSGLWSPIGWQDWKECVKLYLEAQKEGSEEKMTSFYNTILAEPYETSSDVPSWERLLDRANHSNYNRGEIPKEVLFLTSFTDVQKDRLETTLMGWAKNMRPYVIDHLLFLCPNGTDTGDPHNKVWYDWEDLIYKNTFIRCDGVRLALMCSGIDRSFNTSSVSEVVARYQDYRYLIACRGADYLSSPISSIKKDIPASNKTQAIKSQHSARSKGVYYYIETGVSLLKADLYRALREDDSPEQDRRMYCNFANGLDEEYFRQLTAEHFVAPNNKHPKGMWIKDRDRNEALDTFVGNIAMMYYIGAVKFSDTEWKRIEQNICLKKNQATYKPTSNKQQLQRRILNPGVTI